MVPIRIELDIDQYRLRETFVWNLNGTYPAFSLVRQSLEPDGYLFVDSAVTPESFAQTTCVDLEVPSSFASQFAAQIRMQLTDFANHKRAFASDVANAAATGSTSRAKKTKGQLDERQQGWWSRWRKSLADNDEQSAPDVAADPAAMIGRTWTLDADLGQPMDVDALPKAPSDVDDELRILIKVCSDFTAMAKLR